MFDCSSRYEGTSLNDQLLSGPDLTNTMIGVLCRFRRYPVVLTCDIERMFHQFLVNPEDRNYLRFLWWPERDIHIAPVEYRMRVHLFGAASSPGCANYGLKHLAKLHKEDMPLGAQFILTDFYVDDGLLSVETVEKAIEISNEARTICQQGGLRLHKFTSNKEEVLKALPPEDCATSFEQLRMGGDGSAISSTLGIQWNVAEDYFFFTIEDKACGLTRREILSKVASIYDPLGFLSPFTLCGKTILQQMCRKEMSWDDNLTPELLPRWEKWIADFQVITQLKIPRCIMPHHFNNMRFELHHFSDASTSGYGQCSYARMIDMSGRVHCALLMGKSRVAPSKITTIPRLELAAAVVSVKVSTTLKKELRISPDKEVFWTDSKVVLGYISNDSKRFHMYVANRVQTIREDSDPSQWQYVDTKSNPADHASRGLTASRIEDSNLFTGPDFPVEG